MSIPVHFVDDEPPERFSIDRSSFERYVRDSLESFWILTDQRFGITVDRVVRLKIADNDAVVEGDAAISALIERVYFGENKINPFVDLSLEEIVDNEPIIRAIPSGREPIRFGANWDGGMGPFVLFNQSIQIRPKNTPNNLE